MKKAVFGFILAALITGCGKSEPVQTVDWYKEHQAERKAMLEKCRNNPGELRGDKNCINAQKAENKLTWESDKFN